MPITDLTGTTWRLNDNQSLNTNTAFDISFTSGNQNYGLLQVSSDAIHYDNSLAYGETGEYIVVDSSLTLSGNVTNNYRISGATLETQGYSITGNIIIENNGTLQNASEITGEVKVYSGNLFNCTVDGEVYVYGSCRLTNCIFKNRLNIINVQNATVNLDNSRIDQTTNCGGGFNIVNSNVTFQNLSIDLTSSSITLFNRFIIKGSSQVILNNCGIECVGSNSQMTKIVVGDSADITLQGGNMLLMVDNVTPTIAHSSSNNITITGGTYNFNPSLYDFIIIPSGYEVREATQQGITFYRVIKQVN